MDKRIRREGPDVFLEKQLEYIGERLEKPSWPDAVGTWPELDIPRHLSLGVHVHGSREHHQIQHDERHDRRPVKRYIHAWFLK